jgi:hypothetical protein
VIPLAVLLHPRRLWLWTRRRQEIEFHAKVLLPEPYRIEDLLRENVPHLDKLIDAVHSQDGAAIDVDHQSGIRSTSPREQLKDLGLAGAEAFVLYGGIELLEHVGVAQSQIVSSTLSAMSGALLNAANLSASRQAVEALVGSKVPAGLLPFVSPVIANCLQSAEQHCHSLFPQFDSGRAQVLPSTQAGDPWGVDTHLDNPDVHLGESALNPDHAISANPSEIINTSLVEHGVHTGTLATSALDHGGEAAASSAIDHASFHVPWFTLARSSYREIELLRGGKTDWKTSVAHVGTDTVSMAVGAKTGAALGTFLLPGIGTVVGAAAGGMLGRYFGNEFKHRDLNKAVQEYKTHVDQLTVLQTQLEQETTQQFKVARKREQDDLDKFGKTSINEAKTAAASYASWTRAHSHLSSGEIQRLLGSADKDLAAGITKVAGSPRDNWLIRSLWPSIQNEARKLALTWLDQRRRDVALLHSRRVSIGAALSVLAGYGLAESDVRAHLKKHQSERDEREREFHTILQQGQTNVLARRYEAVDRLSKLLKTLADEAIQKLEPLTAKLEHLSNGVLREKKKLGLT